MYIHVHIHRIPFVRQTRDSFNINVIICFARPQIVISPDTKSYKSNGAAQQPRQ